MRIINKQDHQIYFSYAGVSRRGVWLKPGQQSAELPPARLSNPAVQNGLKRGIISVLMSPTDKVAARGVVSDEVLELAIGEQLSNANFDLEADKKRDAAKAAAEAAKEKAAEEAEAAKDKAEEARAVAAKEAAEAEEAKAAAEKEAEEAEEAKAKAEKEAEEAEAAKQAAEDAEAEAGKAAAKSYSKMRKSELLSLCVDKGLAANAGMKVAQLRKMLELNDKTFK